MSDLILILGSTVFFHHGAYTRITLDGKLLIHMSYNTFLVILVKNVKTKTGEPPRGKCGFRAGPTQIRLESHRIRLEA